MNLDEFDLKILRFVQADASLSADQLAEKIGLSRNACWRRLKRLETESIIKRKVALVDPESVELELSVFILIKALGHEPDWLEKFKNAVTSMPEIIGAHRMSGELDYILRVRVQNVKSYDDFYQRLIARVPIADISASFVMEDLKDTTALPI
ncbi:MAG: Lrp/AsnC family transcriptional regulator [Pseudomonadota bacterium]